MIVLVSGGFDPLHVGHVRLLRAAGELGRVVIALNSDEWLYRKKGYFFMDWAERREILLALAVVVPVDDSDGTVCDAIERVRPDCFANGGDRITANPKESAICLRLGVRQLFDLGGGKVQSSSALVSKAWQRLHQ